jgi:hypothetical protein
MLTLFINVSIILGGVGQDLCLGFVLFPQFLQQIFLAYGTLIACRPDKHVNFHPNAHQHQNQPGCVPMS